MAFKSSRAAFARRSKRSAVSGAFLVDGEIHGDAPQDRRHGFHGKPVTPPERGVDLAGGFLKSRHERGGVGKPFLGPSGEKKPRIPVPVQYVLRRRVHGFSL